MYHIVVIVRPKPDSPDITLDEAIVLAYIKKLGGICDLADCEQNCDCYDIPVNLELFQKSMGNDKIRIYRTKAAISKHAIKIMDYGWADSWTTYFYEEIPHHRHSKRLKKIRVT